MTAPNFDTRDADVRKGKPTVKAVAASIRSRYESVIRDVRTDELFIDHTYQHNLDENRAKAYAADFKPSLLRTLVVNQRDPARPIYYVVDGQHRFAAIQLLDDWPETVRCEVFVGLTLAEEAMLYHELNTTPVRLHRLDDYKSLLVGKQPEAMAIDFAVRASGMVVDRHSGPNTVQCIGSVERVFRRYGAGTLTRTLRILHTAWQTTPNSTPYQLVEGIAYLLDREKDLDERRLILVLSYSTPQAVVGKARIMAGARSINTVQGAIEAIRGLYDKALRTKPRLTRRGGADD